MFKHKIRGVVIMNTKLSKRLLDYPVLLFLLFATIAYCQYADVKAGKGPAGVVLRDTLMVKD